MIPHNKPSIGNDDFESVLATLDSKWIAPGKIVKDFEFELAKYLSSDGYAVAVDSGTSALHLSLIALDIKKGDEVIIPTYVCTAILNAINYVGATPVITDINSYDYNISYEDTLQKITPNTKAIIIPHMYGIPADIEKFLELNIPLIEDCAQSIGAKYKNQKVGTFGDISIFSFYATKLLTTAKGGAVFSKNKKLIDDIFDLINFDCRPTYKVRYNYHLSDLQATLGLSQLKKLDLFINNRKEISEEYNEIIEKKKVLLVKVDGSKERVWYRYVIISEEKPEIIIEAFSKEGINIINPLENWELLHNYLGLNRDNFPNSESITQKTVSIPIYPSLSDNEIIKIKKAINKIYQ